MTGQSGQREVSDAVRNAGGLKIMGLITARGGSKGIPRKNVIDFAGQPLISHTIVTSVESGVLDRLIVTTDDPEIAEVSRQWGAETPFTRPAELSGDNIASWPVIVHAVRWLEEHEDYLPDYIMVLQPTSPLRTAEDVRRASSIALDRGADSVISVCESRQHPLWMTQLSKDNRFFDFKPEERVLTRRQSLSPMYFINGSIYLVKRAIVLRQEHFYTEQTYAYVMAPDRSLDIDSPLDLIVVETLFNHFRSTGRVD